jgi:hypothetical protein
MVVLAGTTYPRMQPTGRSVPSAARALIADGDQWFIGLCGRGLEGPQLMRRSLGSHVGEAVAGENLLAYYGQRAEEYEEIYEKPDGWGLAQWSC